MVDIPNPDKDYLINPRLKIKFYTEPTFSIEDLDIQVEINKTLEDEPNNAVVTIDNLNDEYRKKVVAASNEYTPIEIYLTPSGVDELVLAFKGEIESVTNSFVRPGHQTVIYCESQKRQHASVYVTKKTYIKGTLRNDIVMDLIKTINMPYEIEQIPLDKIMISQSFSGPAFPLLKQFCSDFGMYTYILDGVLHISSIYAPKNLIPHKIEKRYMLEPPDHTDFKDAVDVEVRTITSQRETNPLKKRRRKRKKTTKVIGKNDYVNYSVVDTSIPGMNFHLLCQPARQPDDIVMFPEYLDIATTMFRVKEITHYCDNTGGDWDTDLITSVFDPTDGELITGII